MTTPLSPEIAAELDKLRDIRLPEPIGWWPLAPGWWGLLVVCVLAGVALAIFEIRRRRTLRHLALLELAALKRKLTETADARKIGVDLAVLLRRVAVRTEERKSLAGRAGLPWAVELSKGEAGFSPEIARCLADAPYAPAEAADPLPPETFEQAEKWIRRNA